MSFKSIPPNGAHKSFRDDTIKVLAKHGKNLTAEEMLALTAYLVGQLIALQDQRKMTPAMALALVGENIEQGNLQAMQDGLTTINDLPV